MPYNLFDAFKKDCRNNQGKIIISPKAAKDARNIFQLHTEKELLDFIGNDGLDNVRHNNKTPWRKNPDPDKANNPQYVYDYNCRTNGIPYYIAIIFLDVFFGKTVKKWRLKSFHLDDNASQPMRDQLEKIFHNSLTEK